MRAGATIARLYATWLAIQHELRDGSGRKGEMEFWKSPPSPRSTQKFEKKEMGALNRF